MTKLIGEQVLMRIFIGEGDRYEHKPLYEALMEVVKKYGFEWCILKFIRKHLGVIRVK